MIRSPPSRSKPISPPIFVLLTSDNEFEVPAGSIRYSLSRDGIVTSPRSACRPYPSRHGRFPCTTSSWTVCQLPFHLIGTRRVLSVPRCPAPNLYVCWLVALRVTRGASYSLRASKNALTQWCPATIVFPSAPVSLKAWVADCLDRSVNDVKVALVTWKVFFSFRSASIFSYTAFIPGGHCSGWSNQHLSLPWPGRPQLGHIAEASVLRPFRPLPLPLPFLPFPLPFPLPLPLLPFPPPYWWNW